MTNLLDNWSGTMLAGVFAYEIIIGALFSLSVLSYEVSIWLVAAPALLLLGAAALGILVHEVRREIRAGRARRRDTNAK